MFQIKAVKESQENEIQRLKREIESFRDELFKDHRSLIVNGVLNAQATGYISALIIEKNRMRRDAAYKTKMCQIFEVSS
jgi:hypothetical protein